MHADGESRGADRAAPLRASGSAVLAHVNGLHARPAIKLTRLAKRFSANIRVAATAGGPWTDLKSIVKVMAMKTPSGATLYFESEGDDARAAVDALIALVERDFVTGEDDDAAAARQG
ncbi:MAG: HPr family phosphocarrier protein [Candidatus Velthaea sp.]|jgi:phosphocarrier protein